MARELARNSVPNYAPTAPPTSLPDNRAVLITRPREDAARTAELVAARGFLPVVAPFLTIRTCSPSVPAGVQAMLVSSGNALAALPVRGVPLLAVGDATAKRARDKGFLDVRSAGRDGAALVELAVRTLRPEGGPLLFACGARQGFTTAAALRGAGFAVVRRVTYAAVPVRGFPAEAEAALRSGSLYAALFLSAETAAAFMRTLPAALRSHVRNVMALAIGKPAADALQGLPWRRILVPDAPTVDGLLALL
jgi:uroporphyrinogen-III synthase